MSADKTGGRVAGYHISENDIPLVDLRETIARERGDTPVAEAGASAESEPPRQQAAAVPVPMASPEPVSRSLLDYVLVFLLGVVAGAGGFYALLWWRAFY